MAESQSDAYQKLFAFCASGDRIGLANHIVTNRCNPTDHNARDSSGKTPLHVACQHGHLFTVRALVEIFGCSRSAKDNSGNLPIHVACLHGHLNVVDYLIHFRGTDSTRTVLATDSEGNNLLHKACQSGSVPLVRYLQEILCYNSKQLVLRKLSLYVDTVGGYFRMSLKRILSHRKDVLIYRALLEHNLHGDTPLHLACRFGHLSVLKMFRAYLPFMAEYRFDMIAAQSNHFDIAAFILSLNRLLFIDFDSESLVKQSHSLTQQFELLKEPVFDYDLASKTSYSNNIVKKTVFCRECQVRFAAKELSEYDDKTVRGKCPVCNHVRSQIVFYPKCPNCIFRNVQTSVVDRLGECSHCHNRIVFRIRSNSPQNFASDSNYGYYQLLNQSPSHYALECGNLEAFSQMQATLKAFPKNVTLLHAVCVSNNERAVAQVMKDLNCGPNVFDSEGNTPLHIACRWASINVLLYLFEFEYLQTNTLNKAGESPLSIACRNDLTYICKQLLKRTDCTAVPYPDGETPLHLACGNNNLELVKMVVENGGTSFVNTPDKYGDTPMFNACRNGHLDMVKYLLMSNSDPLHANTITKDTPVHIACRMGRSDVLEVLLKAAASEPLKENFISATPLLLAIEGNFQDTIQVLIHCAQIDFNKAVNNKGETLLHFIAFSGYLDLAKSLLKCDSVSWNAQDIEGNTALHIACMQNDTDMVRVIIEQCDNTGITVQNNRKQTPLHIAVLNTNFDIAISMLRSFSGSLDEYRDVDGDSVLHTACKVNAHLDMVSSLLYYCSLIVKNNASEIPLHIACRAGNITIVELLLEHTPLSCKFMDFVDEDGNSVLHAAAKSGCVVTVNAVVRYASPSWTNNEGETPIHLSCRNGDLEVTQALLAKSEGKVVFSDNGESYLHLACCGKSVEMVKFLIDESGLDRSNLFTVNNEGNTPLHCACLSGIFEIISFMVSSNPSDTQKLNKIGLTPFCCLLVKGHVDTVQELLSNTQTELCTHEQPLMHCILKYSKRILDIFKLFQFIISQKISDPLKSDSEGNTILHIFFTYRNDWTIDVSMSKGFKLLIYEILDKILGLPGIQINKPNNNGDTPLHIIVQNVRDEDMLERLLNNGFRDSIRVFNKQGKTPIQSASYYNYPVLIRYGADPNEVVSFFGTVLKHFKNQQPLEPLMKIITVGNSRAGKTTLINTLKQLDSPGKQMQTPDERTTGIETSKYNSKEFGLVTFHDFAGNPEYESVNAVFLKSLDSFAHPPILLLVVDVRSFHLLEKTAQYWCNYIKNSMPTHLKVPPHVIIVGSHSDLINPDKHVDIKRSISLAVEKVVDFHFADVLLLNCQDPKEAKLLSGMLAECRRNLKQAVDVDCRCHILFACLLKWYRSPAVKFPDLQKRIEKESRIDRKILLPTVTDDLFTLLKSLKSRGHVDLLNVENIQQCWIVINSDFLFKEVNGILFAPDDSNLHKLLIGSIMSEQMLKSLFEAADIDLITLYLTHSEFCQRINDQETLLLIESACQSPFESTSTLFESDRQSLNTSQTEASTMEQSDIDSEMQHTKYYFFPGLLKRECPHPLWKDSPQRCFGWYLTCLEHNFFNPRFLHVLLLRLTFYFALAEKSSKQHRLPCDIWKNGIHWSTRMGVEVLVEVVKQNTAVLLLIRYTGGFKLEGVKYRSQVIKKILDTKKEFCPATKVAEYVLSDGSKYPPINSEFFFIGEIAHAISKGGSCIINCKYNTNVDLKTLLYFDSYLNHELFKCLWDEGQDNEDVNLNVVSQTLKEYTDFSFDSGDRLAVEKWKIKMLKLLDSKEGEQSLAELREEFDSFSIFCGRSPLELSLLEEPPQELCDQSFWQKVQNNGHLNLTTGNTVARDVPDGIVLLNEPFSHPHPSASQHTGKTSASSTLVCGDQVVKTTTTVPKREHMKRTSRKRSLSSPVKESDTKRPRSRSLSDRLTLEDHQEVYEKLIDASPDWENLGGALGLDINTLNGIEKKYRGDVQDCLREVITKRLQSDGALTWRDLCECLRSSTVKRNDVAQKIERQLGST